MATPKRARRRKDLETDATPYEGFAEHEDRLTARIETAATIRLLSNQSRYAPEGTYLNWSKGGNGRKPQPLYVEDLAVGLWAVECVGSKGISYGQLARCFKVCRGVGCHYNKASAIFATLQSWGLIVKVGNYSSDVRGNVYAVVPESVELLGIRYDPPRPTPVIKQSKHQSRTDAPPPQPSAPADDDPW